MPPPELKTIGPVDELKPIGVPDEDDVDDELKPIGPVDELKPIGPVDELKLIGAPDEDEDDVELKPIGPVPSDEPEVMVVPTVPVSMAAPLPIVAVEPIVPAPTPTPSWSAAKFAPFVETASRGRAELTWLTCASFAAEPSPGSTAQAPRSRARPKATRSAETRLGVMQRNR